jgi:hypothetical protein
VQVLLAEPCRCGEHELVEDSAVDGVHMDAEDVGVKDGERMGDPLQ